MGLVGGTVVTMSAPRTASAALAQPAAQARTRRAGCVAAWRWLRGRCRTDGSRRCRAGGGRQGPGTRLCAPLPISAIVRLPGRASTRAASADVAAVRIAVVSVSSLSSSGQPVATSASTPNAITVGKPMRVLPGCPLTYLKLYVEPSAIGISSITPSREWLATRALLSNRRQRRKSASIGCDKRRRAPAMPCALHDVRDVAGVERQQHGHASRLSGRRATARSLFNAADRAVS